MVTITEYKVRCVMTPLSRDVNQTAVTACLAIIAREVMPHNLILVSTYVWTLILSIINLEQVGNAKESLVEQCVETVYFLMTRTVMMVVTTMMDVLLVVLVKHLGSLVL